MSNDKTLSRRAYDAMLPKGAAWKVKPGGTMDKYLDAFADDMEIGRQTVSKIERVRDPLNTSALADLEIDFGVLPDDEISESARRTYLSGVKGSMSLETGNGYEIEQRLRAAGFDVYVFQNDPPIDPEDIFFAIPISTCGDGVSTCGDGESRCGYRAGGDSELIVNGPQVTVQRKKYSVRCGDGVSTCVDPSDTGAEDYLSRCGAYDGMIRERYYYPLPSNPARWPFIFWIAAARDGQYSFKDWNMEHAGVGCWDAEDGARLTKTLTHKVDGIRGLLVQQWNPSLINDGPYAEQPLETPIEGEFTVRVTAWDFGTYPPVLMVADKDGVWDTAGKITGYTTGLDAGYVLSYSATNGVSAVRLYAWGALFGADGQCVFDKLEIIGTTFTRAEIPLEQKVAFRKLVLRLKPLETWAALLVDYIETLPIGSVEEDDVSYRFYDIATAALLDIQNDEEAVHIYFKGTRSGFVCRFDDARNFTWDSEIGGRMFRLTNHTDDNITVQNYDATLQKVLLPGAIMQCSLSDNSTLAGDWEFISHIAGDAEEIT